MNSIASHGISWWWEILSYHIPNTKTMSCILSAVYQKYRQYMYVKFTMLSVVRTEVLFKPSLRADNFSML